MLCDKQETQLSLTNRATHLCKCNDVADLLKHALPHMCYHAEFGRSVLKGVGINTVEPQKLGSRGTPLSLGGRRGRPQDTRPSPRVTTSNLVVLHQGCMHK